jgi:hypothetical protein
MSNSTKTQEIPAIRINTGRQPSQIVWQSRYEGFAAVAYVRGKAIAGVSGPWSDKYALTWWQDSMPARQLELFDSLAAAKLHVEQSAQRTSRLSSLLQVLRHNSVSVARSSWLNHVRALLPSRNRHRQPSLAKNSVVQLRQSRLREDMDLSGMNFHAFE